MKSPMFHLEIENLEILKKYDFHGPISKFQDSKIIIFKQEKRINTLKMFLSNRRNISSQFKFTYS